MSYMKICLSVRVEDFEPNIKYIFEEAVRGVMIEIRLDCGLHNLSSIEALSPLRRHLIFTIRSKREGGFYDGTEEDRYKDYLYVISLKPAYIDIELNSDIFGIVAREAHRNSVKVIASYHNIIETPSLNELESVYWKAANEKHVDVIKIVTYAKNYKDNLVILNLLNKYADKKPLIAFCMGKKGLFSRLMAPFLGSWLTYVSLHNRETASGQLPIDVFRELIEVFNYDRR